jgi:hypothetical protein
VQYLWNVYLLSFYTFILQTLPILFPSPCESFSPSPQLPHPTPKIPSVGKTGIGPRTSFTSDDKYRQGGTCGWLSHKISRVCWVCYEFRFLILKKKHYLEPLPISLSYCEIKCHHQRPFLLWWTEVFLNAYRLKIFNVSYHCTPYDDGLISRRYIPITCVIIYEIHT